MTDPFFDTKENAAPVVEGGEKNNHSYSNVFDLKKQDGNFQESCLKQISITLVNPDFKLIYQEFSNTRDVIPCQQEKTLEKIVSELNNAPLALIKEGRQRLFSFNTYHPHTTRKKENVETITAIVFDFDNKGNHTSIEEILERLKQKKLNYFWYTTYSHTCERPKWRLIIPFAVPLESPEWNDFYEKAVVLIGDPPGIDHTASKDIAHMWFVPYKNANHEYDFKSGANLLGILLEPLDIDLLLTSKEKERFKAKKEKENQDSKKEYVKTNSVFPIQQILLLLENLDPNCCYDEWSRIGMALHHEYGGSEEAFKIWDTWSSLSIKYEGLENLRNHWKSFSDNQKPVTIGTLIHIAKKNGYPLPLTSEKDEWPDPLPIKSELLPVKFFDLSLMPDSLRTFVEDCSLRMQCPPDYIGISLISMFSSLIGGGCGIKPKKHDDWVIIPNLWGCIVGNPSTLKTPSISEAFSPLHKIEKRALDDHQEELKKWEDQSKIAKIREDSVKAEIKTQMRKQALSDVDAQKLYSNEVKEILKPSCRRYKTNDSTIEKVQELLSENPRGLMIYRDELVGLLTGWEKDGHESDRAFYLEAWNGYGSFTVDRIGRGTTHVENICVSIFGSTQPDKIMAYLQKSLHALENDGLLQRFQLLVYPDPLKEWKYIDNPPNKESKEILYNLAFQISQHDFFEKIDDLQEVKGKLCFSFNDEAQVLFKEWMSDFEAKLQEFSEPIITQHLAKYRKLMPALALIFHIIDISGKKEKTGRITEESVIRAVCWCEYLESHARRLYGMALNITNQAASALSKKIKQGTLGQRFSLRDTYKNKWSCLKERDTAAAACEELIKAFWLREISTIPILGQKIKTEYIVNPKIKMSRKGGMENE